MQISNNRIKILIVDDEEDIREILRFNLENEGYDVQEASSAEKAIEVLSSQHHLILLDVMMEGMSGFKLADRLRKEGNNIPIIFLTARDTENDMLTGFSIGGDDYISKPFSIKEVIARVRSVLNRTAETCLKKTSTLFEIDNTFVINTETQTVKIDNEIIELTKTEYNILCLFVENEEQMYSRADILKKVWSGDEIVLDRTVDVHIARLRKKIGGYGKYIINRTGFGYSFNRNTKITT